MYVYALVGARARVCVCVRVRAKGRSLEEGGIPLRPPLPVPRHPLQPQANLVSANDGLCREMRASQGRDVPLVTLAGCCKSKMTMFDPCDILCHCVESTFSFLSINRVEIDCLKIVDRIIV